MRITFLNPPFHPMFSRESRSPCVTKSSTLYWPMFLSYAAGTVEADGNEIQLIDSPAMELNLEQTLDGIKKFETGNKRTYKILPRFPIMGIRILAKVCALVASLQS